MNTPDTVGELMAQDTYGEQFVRVDSEPVWVLDIAGADQHARTHPRQLKYPPHWARCNFMRAGERCVKGAGHEQGAGPQAEHEAPKA